MKKQKEGRPKGRAVYKVGPKSEGAQEVARFALMGDKRCQQIGGGYVPSVERTKFSPRKGKTLRGFFNAVHSYGSVLNALVPGRTSVWRTVRIDKNVKAAKGPSYGSVLNALVPGRKSVLLWLLASVFVLTLTLSHLTPVTPAYAAINEQLNFQARLLNASGGLVPDGNYNVQFHIYSGGDGDPGTADETLEWTGTHQNNNSDGVRVVNGYLSVQLGSSVSQVNTLADVDWNDSTLWLSINIGNTGSGASCSTEANFNSNCGGDGEMDPFMRLTSVPYAFNANRLDNLDSTQFVQLGQGLQTDATTASSIAINKTGVTGDILTLQDGGTTELLFDQGANLTLGSASDEGTLVLYDGSSHTGTLQTAALGSNEVYILPDSDGNDTICLQDLANCASALTGTGAANRVTYWTSTTGLAADDDFFFDGTVVGIGDITPDNSSKLDVTFSDTSATPANKSGIVFDISDTGAVGSDEALIGHDINVVHTGGGSGIFTTTGVDINLDVDSGGQHTAIGLNVLLDGQGDNNYAALFNGGDVILGGTTAATADILLGFGGNAVFNEQSNNVDFRVESDNTTNIIGVTASTDSLTLGSANSAAATTLLSGTGDITLTSTDDISINGGGASAAINIGTVATAHVINIGTGAAAQTVTLGSTNTTSTLTLQSGSGLINLNTTQAQFSEVTGTRTLTAQTRTTNVAGTNLTVQAGAAGAGASAFSGGLLTLQGGNAGGTGNANGGNVYLTGGTGVGTGVLGLVVVDTPAFTTASQQSCGINCTITQANVDSTGAVLINATAASLIVSMPDPTITTAGRIIYVTAVDNSNDFTLRINSGGTQIDIAMRENSTATLIWNGSDWTAAGASSSTTLQAAYDNTLTSAGGAEIVLSASGGNADGLTIRNNATTPISGGILEIQTSIGTNLFSVNNLGTELAANTFMVVMLSH